MQLYEREVNLSHNDVFHRLCELDEKPLEMCFLWKISGERKTFVITDHNPNIQRYNKSSIEDLGKRVEKLDTEEKELEEKIRKNYAKAKQIIHDRQFYLKRKTSDKMIN